MNEKTRQRLESELNVPAPTQPIDKLRLHEAHAAEATIVVPFLGGCFSIMGSFSFADDE